MASSSTTSILGNFKYHVFLSFRGEDTRTTFVDHLYASLKRLGIHTFRDTEGLEKGKRINELFKAIKESEFFIIVFSRNYASSSWCLKELAKIMESQDGSKRIAFPLFYDVEPRDVRRQSGPVGIAIAKHKADKQIIKTWKKALKDAGNLVGWDLKKVANGHEAEAIDQIVKEISVKLRAVHLTKDENLVGMESRMQDLEASLGKGLENEVRMIGIKGMGGIGKTTLARAIFQEISSQFEGKSFVENVREASKANGLLSLQQQVLKDVLGVDNVNNVQDAKSLMKDRMPLKKVLLVIDDVDHKDQLEALAGALDWFKGGSRIIITTRNEQVLKAHRVRWIHDINLLSTEEAFSLFNRYAFARYIPFQGYEDLSFKFVKYAAGLPLTLKVLGSFLLGKEKAAWEDTLNRLQTIPEKETLDILEISYNGLEDDQKEIFLDVACFMKRMLKNDAIRRLESCGFHAIIGLKVLEERSLITIDTLGYLGMHDSIEELARNIVRRLHLDEPSKHSRLWIPKEIELLLFDDEVTEATATCISLGWSLLMNPEIIVKGIGKLKKLRLLHISWRYNLLPNNRYNHCLRDNQMFDQDSFPNSLRFLEWESYPGRSLPQTFGATNLVGLELRNSIITQLWESGGRKVVLKKLRFLDLERSKLRTLDLGMTPNLERLNLRGCCDLTEIHAPSGCLERLVAVNLRGCSSFRSSSFIQQLESPELLSLPKLEVTVDFLRNSPSNHLPKLEITCFYLEEQASSKKDNHKFVCLDLHLESFSGSFFGLRHRRQLRLVGCIPDLPNDLDELTNLEELSLMATHIKWLPDSICMLKHLKTLKLESCQLLQELPKDLGRLVCLEKLILNSTSIQCLPDGISLLKHLRSLELIYCQFLEELPWDLGQLEWLEKLILIGCKSLKHIPNNICNMKCLEVLNIYYTGIRHLPQSISSLEGLQIVGSEAVLRLCDFATEIQTSDYDETFCYIQATDNKEAKTRLDNQFMKNFLYRWCRAMVVVVAVLLLMQVMMQELV